MGEVLLTLADLHDKKIIHRDLKPQNLMLAENDAALPLRIIDMGSALIAGQEPIMDDYTEIYAPPEARLCTRTHARTHARTHTRTHARTHTHT